MEAPFKTLMNEVIALSGQLDLGLNPGLKQADIDVLLSEHQFVLPDSLLNAYREVNGNRRIEKEGKLYWDQEIVPFFKGAFHFLSLQESIEWMNKDADYWVPKGCFPIASRVERDYLSIDLSSGELVVMGTYTLQQTIAQDFEQFIAQYTKGLQNGSYILDTEYQYYPRIVHHKDTAQETLSYTFANTEIG